ncbi:MAG: hypothetical protein DA408_00190 [Bacteroidetes bacterium]|nr:MAG: hypothetical protein C7N36_15265 [Bacteroidota bacterium]PTM15074.1 MAG: hypothetical protein DA408_00190 [Bacteroidota bacterium]
MKKLFNFKLKEFKVYTLPIFLFIILTYSTYFIFDLETIHRLGYLQEDGFFECLTAFGFLGAFIFFLRSYLTNKNLFFLLLSIGMFLGLGEELAWGQRIFGFRTPESISTINVQGEFTLHNIEFFNTVNFDGSAKTGLSKLHTANYFFNVCWFSFGILFPMAYSFFPFVARLTQKLRLPVPPLEIGLLFLINLYIIKLIKIAHPQHADVLSYNEVYECNASLIFLVLALYFFKQAKAPTASL